MKELPTIEYLREVLQYDPETGVISWNVDKKRGKKGQPVFTRKKDGYLYMHLKRKSLRVHRVAFVLMTGIWPKIVDHINGNGEDNRFCNLREATKAQNGHNCKLKKTNTSGFKGVWWDKLARKWRTSIRANGKRYLLGSFDKIEDAADAYRQASEILHGEFASHKGCDATKDV